ncbi:MAG: fused response regulator/phosphatase [Cellvibrionales bacterium]|nr:fused response regulator/phosphatase [Cellvibrionales bacterium]
MKVLIAEDSNADRLLLQAIIRKQGYETFLARDGREAIASFEKERPDIVLLDALMPNIDGFETAKYIKEHSGDDFIPIIFLTSLNETESLANCLDAGGDDFLTKPYNPIILKAKINAFMRMVKMHVTLQKQRDQIVDNNLRLIREQEVAKSTFDKIAHEGSLQADNIQYQLSPLAIFNGDVLLAANRPNGNLIVILGDFTGHGLSAAMGAIPLSQAFYSMVSKGFSIKEIAYELNKKLKDILPVGIFCCASIVDFNFVKQQIELWNGGLPDNVIFRKNGEIKPLEAKHLPLGILANDQFNHQTQSFQLSKDDYFYMWTDGILEAENKSGEQFGEQRLMQLFDDVADPSKMFHSINQAVTAFAGDCQLSDDRSLVAIRMIDHFLEKEPKPQPTGHRIEAHSDWVFTLQLLPDSIREKDPLPLLQQLLLNTSDLRRFTGELFVIISELYNNALDHGLLKLDSHVKSSPNGFSFYYTEREQRLKQLDRGFIHIRLEFHGSKPHGQLAVEVEDSGEGFNYQEIAPLQKEQKLYSGRGIALVQSLCTDLNYLGKGNKVRAIFSWN